MIATRKYTPEEKQQLIQNLDIEVQHRVRQLEEWLAVALDNFRLHQEALISRIPKVVRGVSMGEFADKYNGDIQACLRGLQSERMGGVEFGIDRDTRKRKWAAAQEEVEASGSGQHEARAPKNARIMTATPKKVVAGTSRTRTPGPRTTTTTTMTRPSPASKLPIVRATSPAKQIAQRARPPSSATFNPSMPSKAPTYPTLRAPRRDESMLSVNGSPLANPYALGLGWFTSDDIEQEDEESHLRGKGKQKQQDRRVNSIVIRRDPSVTLASSSSSQSQTNTRTHLLSPTSSAPVPPLSQHPSALVSIPIKDGHLLEFDPLTTSPRAFDKLVGITESAKKQAKEEMARLVREAVRKWVIE